MRSREELINIVDKFNETGRHKTFAEFICELFKDKYLEIYMGDSFEEVSTEQVSVAYPAVFCGKVLGAFKECLILDSFYNKADKTGNKTQLHGNIMFINERAIRSIVEIDGHGTINDLFVKSGKESASIIG